ncbi:MAG TPA: N-acetylmuramoyl-L-alanine amidase [Longimicrobiaceae bacterium]|nr:N-acetylmuramoyl-L-alanine amidase [Longimicrobiaceae bacterium]
MIRTLPLLFLLLTAAPLHAALAGQQPGESWRVESARESLVVREETGRGYPALPLSTLVTLGAEVGYARDGVLARLGGFDLRFTVGSGEVHAGSATYRLANPVYEEGGAVFVPVQFFRDFLPVAVGAMVSVDGGARVLRRTLAESTEPAPRPSERVTYYGVMRDVQVDSTGTVKPDSLARERFAADSALAALAAGDALPTSPIPVRAASPSSRTQRPAQADQPAARSADAPPPSAQGDTSADAEPAGAWPGGTGDDGRPRKKLVVVDAGHGGVDPGARGPGGTREKDVTLAVARRLAAILRQDTTLDVRMTRDRDTLISLRDRPGFANGWRRARQPAVFISVHCNANPSRSARGFETYFLSEAKTEDARRVEAMENAAQRYEEQPGHEMGALDFIFHDLRQNQYLRESNDWAEVMARRMGQVAGPDRGIKQAGFAVLNGAFMPALLVEIGFITNPVEERLLATPSHQQAIAEQLAGGVRDFLRQSDRMAAR